MTGRKITGLPLPETPREAPPEIHGLVEAIEVTLSDADAMEAAHVLGRTFEYLTRYFSGVAGAIAQHLQLPGDPSVAADFEAARLQLRDRMESLGDQATDPLSKLIRGVFYVGATRKAPTPRRHARLLDLGGIPIRGYRSLAEWIAIAPGTGDLGNESKANRELLRYLPILKEWLTATATYFLDTKQSALEWRGPNQLFFSFETEGVTLQVGPIELPEPLAALLPGGPPRAAVARGPAMVEATPPAPRAEVVSPTISSDASEGAPVVEPSEARPVVEPSEASPMVEPLEQAPPETLVVPAVAVSMFEIPEPAPLTTSADIAPPLAEIVVEPEPVREPVAESTVERVAEPPTESDVEPVAPPVLQPVEPAIDPAETALDSFEPKTLELEAFVEAEDAGPGDVAGSEIFEPMEAELDHPIVEEPTPTPRPAFGSEAFTALAAPRPEPSEFSIPISEARAFGPPPDAVVEETPDREEAFSATEPEVSNPFELPPTSPVEPTVMLRLEDLPFEVKPAVLQLPDGGDEDEDEDEDQDFDDYALPDLGYDDGLDDFAPHPVGNLTTPSILTPPAVAPAVLTTITDPEETPSGKVERVAPKLFPNKEKPAPPQISVNAPLVLYPVVTGPPPEFFDEIPVDADYPEVLQTALTDLNGAIEANDSLLICGQMQRCFDLMIQFFAGIAGAVLQEIDSDQLFDFDLEGGRFDLETKLELVVSALSSLEEHWENNDAGTLLWAVFYDTLLPATDPNSAYLHTRLLGVEGLVPASFMEFSELCSVVPGKGVLSERSACRETAHHYLPILAFWLENATPLFMESEVDFVEEEGGEALSWAASVAGSTLDGTPSGLWLEIAASRWNLPRPELAPVFVVGDAPDVLLPLVDEINSALEAKNFPRAGLYVRVALDFLIQYFAGCSAALWREQGEMSSQAADLYNPEASLEAKERLLVLSLGSLSAQNPVGASLGKLFSKGSLQYRALVRREVPMGMGPIAAWAGSRDELSEQALLTYLPLLRSWLGAANPWFVAGEQLFEEPASDGRLEGVVAFGDDFLEMVDPEYVIRLAPECMELLAGPGVELEDEEEDEGEAPEPSREFTGELPILPFLDVGPPLLIAHVARLIEAGDDRRAANAWLGSAFKYLIQYFAGLATTVLGGKEAPLRKPTLAYFNPKASLREREQLLAEGINLLKDSSSGGIQDKVRDIFILPNGEYRLHSRYVGAQGPASLNENEMLLSFWCRSRHQIGTLTTEEFRFAVAALSSWIEAAKPFFSISEHYAEDPGADGQEEMVVELAEDYLDMVLPDYAIQVPARGYYELLYRESEAIAAEEAALFFPDDIRPELLGPKTVELGGIADDGDDLLMGAATTDLGGDDFFGGAEAYDSSDLFSGPAPKAVVSTPVPIVDSPYHRKGKSANVSLGSTPVSTNAAPPAPLGEEALAEAESEAAGRRRKKKRARKNELGTAVLELYKKERLEKARRRAEARARKEEAEPTRLHYKLDYRGLKNSKQLGGRCHFGVIELSNTGGGELKGTVEPSHPSVKVQPSRFEGNEVRVIYQIDPSDMPSTGRVGISLNTQDERIEVRMERLVPTSWSRERTTMQVVALMLAPSAVYAVWLLYLTAFILGPSIEEGFSVLVGSKAADGLAFKTNLLLWIYAMLAILPGATGVPAALKVLFSKWDYSVQEELRKPLLPLLMFLPTLIMAGTMYGTSLWTFGVPLAKLPILASRGWLTFFTGALNALAIALFSLQTTVWWEDNSDSKVARRAFRIFWFVTVAIGIGATFLMSMSR